MYPLNTNIQNKSFSEFVFIVVAKVFLLINVVDDKILCLLTCTSEFNHANNMMSDVETIKKLAF